MQSIKDQTSLFIYAISQFLKLDEKYRKSWRYKHQQERLKAPRREALANARAWAGKVREYMETCTQPDTIERYSGKMYTEWIKFMEARDANIDAAKEQKEQTLKSLKNAEVELKQLMRGLNALLAQ